MVIANCNCESSETDDTLIFTYSGMRPDTKRGNFPHLKL